MKIAYILAILLSFCLCFSCGKNKLHTVRQDASENSSLPTPEDLKNKNQLLLNQPQVISETPQEQIALCHAVDDSGNEVEFWDFLSEDETLRRGESGTPLPEETGSISESELNPIAEESPELDPAAIDTPRENCFTLD